MKDQIRRSHTLREILIAQRSLCKRLIESAKGETLCRTEVYADVVTRLQYINVDDEGPEDYDNYEGVIKLLGYVCDKINQCNKDDDGLGALAYVHCMNTLVKLLEQEFYSDEDEMKGKK